LHAWTKKSNTCSLLTKKVTSVGQTLLVKNVILQYLQKTAAGANSF